VGALRDVRRIEEFATREDLAKVYRVAKRPGK
jgi:hypothetical protein